MTNSALRPATTANSTAIPTANTPQAGAALRWGLWLAQGLLALMYLWGAVAKLLTPLADTAKMMPWVAAYTPGFVHMTGVADLTAGLGILLPALTRVAPHLTVWAAVGASVLQVCAMVFHALRGEFSMLPLNLALLALALFVVWGRTRKAPIAARSARSTR